MFRGLTQEMSKVLLTSVHFVLGFALLLMFPTSAEARKISKGIDDVTGKAAAPDIEDHASWYARNRKDVSEEDLRKADELRLKTIASIQSLLKGNEAKASQKFELLLRMGVLFTERHDFLREIELRNYTNQFDRWSSAGKKGKEPKLTYDGSRSELSRAANVFRTLVTEFPRQPRTDAALYELAKTLGRLNNENAILYYKQLIKDHPNSHLLADAYLAMGEFYFERHRIADSIESYKNAMKFKSEKAYPFAVYKLGWAYYNAAAKSDKDAAANYEKSITAFKLVIKLSERNIEKGNLDLRQEALNDLVMVWAETEDTEGAWRYFSQINEKDAFYKMLERLGWLYSEAGKNSKAVAVYERLLNESPLRANNPTIRMKIASLHELTNSHNEVVKSMEVYGTTYLGNTAWRNANKAKPDMVAEADRLGETNIHRYGALFHKRGQKAKSQEMMRAAAALYTLYLQYYEANTNSYEIRYYLADILLDFKKWEQAATHFSIVAKARKDGKFLKEAALNAVICMNNAISEAKYPKLPPPGQVTTPIAIPAQKTRLVEVIDTFITVLPKDKEGEPMRYTAAQVYFDYGHYPEAMKRFAGIVEEVPTTKQANAAAKVILAFYAEKEDWTNVIQWSARFSKSEKLMKTGLGTFITETLKHAMFKLAMSHERKKENDRAAAAFMDYQKTFPSDKDADKAVYNASLNYFKLGRVEDAIGASRLLLERYPKSTLRPDVLASMGETHESLGQFDEASRYYTTLARDYPRDKRSPDALFNAALLRKGLHDLDGSIALFTQFQNFYGKDKQADEATQEIASLQERKGQYPAAIKTYERLAQTHKGNLDKSLWAESKAAELTYLRVNAAAGTKALERVQKRLSAKDGPAAFDARQVVSSTLFKSLDPAFGDFKQLRIDSAEQINTQAVKKQQKLEQIAKGYQNIIALGNAEFIVASLYRLGEMHDNFAETLFRAPPPRNSNQVEANKFKSEIEKSAFPLREEGRKFFDTAFKRSQDVETFSPWTKRAYQKQVELNPTKYAALREVSAEPGYLSHNLTNEPAVADLVEE